MLLPFAKKNSDQASAPKGATAQKPQDNAQESADFVPYYCHYNPETILTKNGELLQIIKVDTTLAGLSYEDSSEKTVTIRDSVRQAILENIKSDSIACWIHTVRRKKPIQFRGEFKEEFAQKLQNRWQRVHRWNYQYYNEIYIVIIHDGQTSLLADVKNISSTVLPKRNRNFRNRYIDNAFQELDKVVLGMMECIRGHFTAARLALVERIPSQDSGSGGKPIFYSEPMEFLGLLLNLRNEQIPLPQADISVALTTSKITFGFNALETKSLTGKRRFAAILTLKQYREAPSETMDRLLQLPMEFIVTQNFHFVPEAGYLESYITQKEMFEISGDTYCIEASGIADILSSKTGKTNDFAQQQTTFMVLADEYKQLDVELNKIQVAFSQLGLITIREDIKLEECYWSQLAGNFVFIRRQDIINAVRVGGFCRLNRYPIGTSEGNHWGEAVTIFPTMVGSPYFFNLHHQDNGHTVLMDFNSFNDQIGDILLNFIITQTRKYDGKLYVFDRDLSTEIVTQKLGGDYHYFSVLSQLEGQSQLRINPFLLEDNKRNRSFLLAWVTLLIASTLVPSDEQKAILKAGVDAVYEQPEASRHLNTYVEFLASSDVALAKAFSKWQDEGVYAGILNSADENLDLVRKVHGFDMTSVVRFKECTLPIFSYLLHKIVAGLDGSPTVIILRDALDLIDNNFIGPRLESLMEILRKNNALFIFTSKNPFNFIKSSLADVILKQSATHLFIPDDVRQEYAVTEFGLNEYDAHQLSKMERQKGAFILRQNHGTVGLSAPLKELEEFHSILANDIKTLGAAGGKLDGDMSDD